ncbi:MAG: carboxyl transferase domain-containing protein [Acidimicrobiales bacterium]
MPGVVSHLNWRKLRPGPTMAADEPVHDADDLLGMVSLGLPTARHPRGHRPGGRRQPLRGVQGRYGTTLVCGWASIHGCPVGILGNNGALFSESAEKATQFIRNSATRSTCRWCCLQKHHRLRSRCDFEHSGIKNSSLMINAMSNSTVPHITVIIGLVLRCRQLRHERSGLLRSYLWPTAKIAVMGYKQMAGVMSIVERNKAARQGRRPSTRGRRQAPPSWRNGRRSSPLALYATSRVSDDGIIDPRDTRTVIGMSLSYCHNNVVQGAPNYGVFRP